MTDVIDEVIEETIEEPINEEPEPIADYSEGKVIDDVDINDEDIPDVIEDVVEETIEEDYVDNSVTDEMFEEAYAVDVVEEPEPDKSVLEEPTEPEEEYVDSFEIYSRIGTKERPYEYSNGGETFVRPYEYSNGRETFVPTLLR